MQIPRFARDDKIKLLSSPIHRLVRQSIRNLVVFPQSMADFKVLQPPHQLLCLFVQLTQFRMPNFIDAFHLPHHQLGIANHLERLDLVFSGVTKRRKKSLILSVVVGMVPEILAKLGNWVSGCVLNSNSITRRPGITTSSAINVGSMRGSRGFWRGEKIAGSGRAWRHRASLLGVGSSRYLPVASRVANRCGKLAARIFSCATRRL
jgi:hypothetical protein